MKTFVAFLAGALLGSIAIWFFVIGRQDAATVRADRPGVMGAPEAPPAPAPGRAGAPVLQPAGGPVAAGAVAPSRVPTAASPGSGDAASPTAPPALPPAAAVLPPESTPVAPVAAPPAREVVDAALLPPGPMRALALSMPVQGVAANQLRDTYTDARGGDRAHEAIDIMAPRGTEDGTIAKLFDSKQGGLTVYQFDPAGELAYYYAHLDRYAPGLAEGKAVRRGDLIGFVGHTGNADPASPHLHFAIFRLGPGRKWWQGTPVNPYPYLRGH
jgi:murein DD-endopeptidase MepM/ murein hydrolase activator NlpD